MVRLPKKLQVFPAASVPIPFSLHILRRVNDLPVLAHGEMQVRPHIRLGTGGRPHQADDVSGLHSLALLHRRLSVIDPGHGRQPMTLGGKTIVYNGELYNAPELRQELIDLGETFDTASDTEVLLRAYLRWGDRCPKKLNGSFAFAV